MVKVLFVCTGNICRSPTAEGVFRAMAENAGLGSEIEIDSAGTGNWHVGEPPDNRSQAAARARGIDISSQQARQVGDSDYDNFDYVISMDQANFDLLEANCPEDKRARLSKFLDFAPAGGDVPDPYFGGPDGFEHVLDLIETASAGLLAHIRRTRI